MALLLLELSELALEVRGLYLCILSGRPVGRPFALAGRQEVPRVSACLEEAHSLGVFSPSCKEVLNTSNV